MTNVMVSFDVTSLYTNISVKNTLYIMKELLKNEHEFKKKTNIPLTEFLDLIIKYGIYSMKSF